LTKPFLYDNLIEHRFVGVLFSVLSEGLMEPKNVRITLECTECKQRNYDTTKNKKNDPDRIELKKYCRFCKKRTVHKEAK